MIHVFISFAVPFAVAITLYRRRWLWPFVIMLLGMAIDLDHLLADPIYDPTRCSIGFHPLHTIFPILGYIMLLGFKKTRLLGMGLCIHIVLDLIDCRLNTGLWYFQQITNGALVCLS